MWGKDFSSFDEPKNVKRELVFSKDASKWQGMVKTNTEKMRSGESCFELYGSYTTSIESDYIPVDLQKTYRLSCAMRSLDEKNLASGNFGLRMYDKDKRSISIMSVVCIQESETILTVPAKGGTKELSLETNSKWLEKKMAGLVVAFHVKNNYEDLPNFDTSLPIGKILDEGKQLKVLLGAPLSKDYPAGTKVRLHMPYGAPLYWIADGWMPVEWKEFSTTLKGEALLGSPANAFWHGTKYVKVFAWFGNWNRKPNPDARLLIDDLSFIEE